MNSDQQAAVVSALKQAGITQQRPLGGVGASGSLAGQLAMAKKSLQEPEAAPHITPAGAFQLERKGSGDVQEVVVGLKREIPKASQMDGNISADDFDRIW